MIKIADIEFFTVGRRVKMYAGWNDDSSSLVGQIGKVAYWKPFSIFENPNRVKVVFPDGSYVICDPSYLRPLLRDVVIEKFASVCARAVIFARENRLFLSRFTLRRGD